MTEFIEKAKEFLRGRKASYCRVFNLEARDARVVLADLARFCRATKSTAHPDSHMAARLDGRREVWLRIADHMNLSTEELYRIYHNPKGDV